MLIKLKGFSHFLYIPWRRQRRHTAAMSNSFHRKIFPVTDIGDDILSLILSRLSDPRDRFSVSLVAKQWQRVEGLTRSYLHVFEPDLMDKFLPRFPNLTTFECSSLITDADLELLASTCSKLETLALDFDGYVPLAHDDDSTLIDVTCYGLCAIAEGCRNLSSVSLRERIGIGDEGVIRLVDGLLNLTCLDLTQCSKVTDRSLVALGKACRLQSLNLKQCPLITDNGLISLASGRLLNTMKKLVFYECGQITDRGVTALRLMSSLEELNLDTCGLITDIGGQAISCIRSLKILDWTWLNIGDTTLELLAGNCKALKKLVISGCLEVTGYGIRCFASHRSLEVLVMGTCFNFSAGDVNYLLSSCKSLTCIKLSWGLRYMSMELQADACDYCSIEWI